MFSGGSPQPASAGGAASPYTSPYASPPAAARSDEPGSSSVHELLFGEETEEEDLFFDRLDDNDFSALAAAIGPTPRSSTPPPPLWASSPVTSASGEQLLSADSLVASPLGCRGAPDLLSPLSVLAVSPMLHQSPGPGFPPGCPSVTGGAPALADTSLQASVSSSCGQRARTSSYDASQTGVETSFYTSISGGQKVIDSTQSPTTTRTATSTSTVCLLVVGGRGRASVPVTAFGASNPSALGTTLGGLADVVSMLTKELERHGLTPEIDHVLSGERAVQRVKALARHGLCYKMVLLEVEDLESLAGAAATAWDLREANATAPIAIVAIAPLPPQALLREAPRSSSSARSAMMSSLTSSFQARPQQPHNDEALRHFNECLTVPVTGVEVSGLAQRWLLAPALPVMGGAMVASRAGGLGCFGRSTNSSVQLLGAPLSFPAQQTGRYGHNHRGALACLGAGMQASHPLSTARASILQQAQAATSTGLPPNGMIMMNMNGMMTAQDHDNCLTRTNSESQQYPSASAASQPPDSVEASVEASGETSGEGFSKEANEAGRVFGGGSDDRTSPCGLFGREFATQNAEAQKREFDFVFNHGTVVLRVEENDYGALIPVSLFDGAATNKKTADSILGHIEDGHIGSISSYINLKSDTGEHDMASFVSCRPLSQKPRRKGCERLPPWYVLLKVCLPSTIGLVKEPQLLDEMYSRSALEIPPPSSSNKNKRISPGRTVGCKATSKGRTKSPLFKRGAKKTKAG